MNETTDNVTRLLDQGWLDLAQSDLHRCTCEIASAGPIHLVLGADKCPVHTPAQVSR